MVTCWPISSSHGTKSFRVKTKFLRSSWCCCSNNHLNIVKGEYGWSMSFKIMFSERCPNLWFTGVLRQKLWMLIQRPAAECYFTVVPINICYRFTDIVPPLFWSILWATKSKQVIKCNPVWDCMHKTIQACLDWCNNEHIYIRVNMF